MTSRDTREKNSSKSRPASTKKTATSLLAVSTINPIMDMAARNSMSKCASVPTVRESRMTHSADEKDRYKPNERVHDPPLTAYHWMSDYRSDLIPPKPTPNHKEKDR